MVSFLRFVPVPLSLQNQCVPSSSYNLTSFLIIPSSLPHLLSEGQVHEGQTHLNKTYREIPYVLQLGLHGRLSEQCTQPSVHYPYDLGPYQSNKRRQVAEPE